MSAESDIKSPFATRQSRLADIAGLGLSSLCLVHCLALPLAASLLPLAGAWAEAAWVHWAFAFVAVPLSAYAFTRPHPRGLSTGSILLATAGATLLFAGAAEFPSHALETPITVGGGLLLASAHLLNWRRRSHRH